MMTGRTFQPPQQASDLFLKKFLLTGLTLFTVLGVGLWGWCEFQQRHEAQAFYAMALDALSKDDPYLAEEKVNQALLLSDQAAFHVAKATIHLAKDEPHQAEAALARATQLAPDNSSYLYKLAELRALNHAPESDTLPLLRQVVSKDAKNTEAQLLLANVLFQFGHTEESLSVLRRLVAQDPSFEVAWDAMAGIYQQTGNTARMIDTLKAALKQMPKHTPFWLYLGNAYQAVHDRPNAIRAFTQVMRLDNEGDWGLAAAKALRAMGVTSVPKQLGIVLEDSLPAEFRGSHVYVRAFVQGREGLFLLDTGATDSVLFTPFTKNNPLNLPPNPPRQFYDTAGGIISAPVYSLPVKLGRFHFPWIRFGVIPPANPDVPFDGIIGMNVVGAYRLTIDRHQARVLLSRD
jgi:predicted Zn-dependent protease